MSRDVHPATPRTASADPIQSPIRDAQKGHNPLNADGYLCIRRRLRTHRLDHPAALARFLGKPRPLPVSSCSWDGTDPTFGGQQGRIHAMPRGHS